jgi:hypothetical protein
MELNQYLDQYIKEIIIHHPEFTHQEIQNLCDEYLLKFNKKTKESSKIKSITKYLSKEFGVDF